jgi:AraC-like DNA-binding protein/quercetin dioxygenase-like cupin family protein
MLHKEIRTYTLTERSNFSPHFSIQRMENLYSLSSGEKPVLHRHDYYNIYFIEKGIGSHVVDYNKYDISDLQLYFILPGQIHQLLFDSEPKGFIVSFTDDFIIANSIPEYLINDIYLFDDYGESPPLSIHNDALLTYHNIFHQMESYLDLSARYTSDAVGALVKLLLIQCNNHCSMFKSDNPQYFETTNHLLREFKRLLNLHFTENHKVGDYASKLAVTSDYLNKTIKSITGKTAKEHIQAKLILEAKRALLFMSKPSVKELSYSLGFDESAHFNNFFKKQTGLTPFEFKSSAVLT